MAARRGLLQFQGPCVIYPARAGPSRRHRCCGCSSGVEHNLAKVGVEGSNPFARSNIFPGISVLAWAAALSAAQNDARTCVKVCPRIGTARSSHVHCSRDRGATLSFCEISFRASTHSILNYTIWLMLLAKPIRPKRCARCGERAGATVPAQLAFNAPRTPPARSVWSLIRTGGSSMIHFSGCFSAEKEIRAQRTPAGSAAFS